MDWRVEALELELIQPHMAQKPVLRGEVGCACVAREVSACATQCKVLRRLWARLRSENFLLELELTPYGTEASAAG